MVEFEDNTVELLMKDKDMICPGKEECHETGINLKTVYDSIAKTDYLYLRIITKVGGKPAFHFLQGISFTPCITFYLIFINVA